MVIILGSLNMQLGPFPRIASDSLDSTRPHSKNPEVDAEFVSRSKERITDIREDDSCAERSPDSCDEQLVPDPEYPAKQLQLKEPAVFEHAALRSQLCKRRLHSFTSSHRDRVPDLKENPVLQTHVKDPAVLLHKAEATSQLCVPRKHSFKSAHAPDESDTKPMLQLQLVRSGELIEFSPHATHAAAEPATALNVPAAQSWHRSLNIWYPATHSHCAADVLPAKNVVLPGAQGVQPPGPESALKLPMPQGEHPIVTPEPPGANPCLHTQTNDPSVS